MTYRGHIKNGQVALDLPVPLPEGAEVEIHLIEKKVQISSPHNRHPLPRIEPLRMPGGSLADELVRDRR